MPWTTPTDRTTGYVVSAADWNIVEDNLTYLYGDTGWTNASGFTNSWAVGADTPRYRLVGSQVSMQGRVTGGTLATAAFTLPSGYRPSMRLVFATDANGAYGQLVINTTGTIVPTVGSTTQVSICCTFSIL